MALLAVTLFPAVATGAQVKPLRLTGAPATTTASRTATFTWAARGSARCKLDARRALPCRSARRYRNLLTGKHRFTLRVGARSVTVRWSIVRRRSPSAPLDPAPSAPTSGQEAPTLAPPAPAPITLSADPGLFPAYEDQIPDYVVRCADQPVTVSGTAPLGSTVRIDGGNPRTGSFAATVPLRQGQRFSVAVTNPLGSREHHIRCLPSDMPAWSVERDGGAELAFYLVSPALLGAGRYVMFFDRFGVPVWWLATPTPALDAKLLSDDTVAYAGYLGSEYGVAADMRYDVRRLDGSLARSVTAVGNPVDHHELVEVGNGDVLVLTYRPRDHVDLSPFGGPSDATVVDGEIQQIAADGSLVWSWNSKDHVALAETGRWWPSVLSTGLLLPSGQFAYDPFHINAISVRGDQLLISARHVDAVYAIERSTGAVAWKLGGTDRPERLSLFGDHEPSLFGGQHDVRALDDGTITVYDNGSGLARAPRALRFALDIASRSATVVESLVDPAIGPSSCCGSARKLPGGGWLIGWGGVPSVGEYDAQGTRRLSLTFSGGFSYRAFPVPAGRISVEQLRAGMDAQHPRD